RIDPMEAGVESPTPARDWAPCCQNPPRGQLATSIVKRGELLPGELRDLLFRQGPVVNGDLIQPAFPVVAVVAAAAEKQLVETRTEARGGLGFDFQLAVEVDLHGLSGTHQRHMLPFPAGEDRFAGGDGI